MARGKEFLERLRTSVLLGDGAMGTVLYSRGVPLQSSYEAMNVRRPDIVKKIHEDYLAAGADVIETNTYQANRFRLAAHGLADQTREITLAGARLAVECAQGKAFVAGSVGPVNAKPEEAEGVDVPAVFREAILALADGGVDVIFLETFFDIDELATALRVARSATDLPVVCMMAAMESGRTPRGVDVVDASRRFAELGADAYGTNCGKGPKEVIAIVRRLHGVSPLPIAAFPNAGHPEYVDGRFHYLATPEYMGDAARTLIESGASLVGGCCGTDPDDTRAMRAAIGGVAPARRIAVLAPRPRAPEPPLPPGGGDAPWLKRSPDGIPRVVVELDPPKNLDYRRVVRHAKILARLGVDAITVGDSPLALIRMSNLAMSHLIEREAQVPVVLHLSCRDRNLIGLQGEVMGAHALGQKTILALTGDPAKIGNQPGATSVYDLNSFGLVEMLSGFNRGVNLLGQPMVERTSFTIGVALNPNGRKMDAQVKRLERKVSLGAHFAMTQPVYDLDRIREMADRCAPLGVPIFLGVLPLVSEKNALYIHNEVPGIDVPDDVIRRMRGLEKEAGRRAGLEMAKEIIRGAWELVRGFYIIPTFERLDIATELVQFIQDHALSRTRTAAAARAGATAAGEARGEAAEEGAP